MRVTRQYTKPLFETELEKKLDCSCVLNVTGYLLVLVREERHLQQQQRMGRTDCNRPEALRSDHGQVPAQVFGAHG
jgi:hypothetical protein